jgi:Uma2 family endonuclease
MAAYMANGARLGWLLFPERQAVVIGRAGGAAKDPGSPQRIEPVLELEDGELLPGLRLELAEIWSG